MSNDKNQTTCETTQNEKYFTPAADIYTTTDHLIAVIDMPGVGKGDVTIEIDENNILSVKGKQSFHTPDNPVLNEFSKGCYYRAFSLGDSYNREAVSASLDNGILELRIPLLEEQKPRKIEIAV